MFPEHWGLFYLPEQPGTILTPCLFGDMQSHNEWVYRGQAEVLRSRCVFAVALGTLAVDMVQADLFGPGKEHCHLLVLWGLLKPLRSFEEFDVKDLFPRASKSMSAGG